MTPVMPLIYALDVQLDRILEEGLDNRFARHTAMAKRTQNWAIAHGNGYAGSGSLSLKDSLNDKNTRALDIAALNKFLVTKGMRIANGYGDLKDKTFRIAHMGEITMSDVDSLLANMEEFMG